MRGGPRARLRGTGGGGGGGVHWTVVASAGTGTAPGARAEAGWRASSMRRWGGAGAPLAVPSSRGPVKVQGAEGGPAKRPLQIRCARRRPVSPGPLTCVMRAAGVDGKGDRGEEVGSQAVGARERDSSRPSTSVRLRTQTRRVPASHPASPAV